MGSAGGPPGPTGGGGEPSSNARMRIDFERQPSSEPPIFRDGDTFFDGLTGPMVISQGENSAISRRTIMRGEQDERTGSNPRGVGWLPILGQNFAAPRTSTAMETDRGPFGIHSLTSLGVELASIGGQPPPPRRDGLRSSVELSTLRMRSWRTRVFQNGVVVDAVRLGLSLLVQRGKDQRLRNLLALWLAAMPLMLVSIL
jgi:hypothetical protein